MRRRLLALIGRSRAIHRRGRLDDELREEIEQHIELRRDQLIDAGVDPHEALVMARRQFGNVTRVREARSPRSGARDSGLGADRDSGLWDSGLWDSGCGISIGD